MSSDPNRFGRFTGPSINIKNLRKLQYGRMNCVETFFRMTLKALL